MRSAVLSMLGRALVSFRLVMISSNSGSRDVRLMEGVGSGHLSVCYGRGKKISSTHGLKVDGTGFRCVYFVSKSSV